MNSGSSGAYKTTENIAAYGYDRDGQLISADPGTGITHTAVNYLANSYDLNGNPNGVEGEVGTDNELTNDGTYTYSSDTSGDLTH